MTPSISTLLIVAFASLLLGVVAGLLINSLRGEPEEETKPANDTPPGGRPGGYVPVVRLWREKKTETLVVEVDGKSFVSAAPLSLAQVENLEKALAELSGWLGVTVTASPARASVPAVALPSKEGPSAPAQAPAQVPTAGVAAVQPTVPPTVSTAAVSRAPAKPPAAQQPPKEEPKSIVGQIDAILQEMLEQRGMTDRGIALNEDPRRGVIVTIGLEHFEGIDAVTDPEVKQILRAAVSEWERRQERPQLH